jgi:hypothetical protein
MPSHACGTLGVGNLGGPEAVRAILARRPDPPSGKDNASLRNWLVMDILRDGGFGNPVGLDASERVCRGG